MIVLTDPLLDLRISKLHGKNADAVALELGAPELRSRGDFKCPPSWRCPACVDIEESNPFEVWIYSGSQAHYLAFDASGRLIHDVRLR